MQKEDAQAFKRWYIDFVERHGGEFDFDFKNVDEIERSHKEIREQLGGIRFETDVHLKSCPNKYAVKGNKEFSDTIVSLSSLLGNSLKISELQEVLSKGYLENGAKASKWVMNTPAFQLAEDSKKQEINQLLSKAGQIRNSFKQRDKDIRVEFYTTAKGFAMLGKYGPDSGSCFSQGSDSSNSRVSVALASNSFVCIIKQYTEDGNKSNMYRSWGIFSPKSKSFFFINEYFKGPLSQSECLTGIKEAVKKITGADKIVDIMYEIDSCEGIYLNGHSCLALCPEKNLSVFPDNGLFIEDLGNVKNPVSVA